MGIDRIPGVGPTNADIATAVAAPSAATIAAAVAAPSAATIASTVAGSVPTLAQINTSVSTNASPFGGTWVLISNQTLGANANTISFSGLSSYKYLKIIAALSTVSSSQSEMYIRFNGDTASNYSYANSFLSTGSYAKVVNPSQSYSTSIIQIASPILNPSGGCVATIEIFRNDSSVLKNVKSFATYQDANTGNTNVTVDGHWWSTSVISSMTLFTSNGNYATGSKFAIYGGY